MKIGRSCVLFCLLYSFLIAQETLNICVLRVQFRQDSNDLTTGDGRFMMDGSAVEPYTIDPPPHNRSYFKDQVIAVRNYFLQASSGRFIVNGEVFPLHQDSAYTMEQTMGYYSPNRTEEDNNERLAQLFVDAVTNADRDPSFHFADYDPLVVIFHAGVGKDIDLGYDTTPQDIPSLYLGPDFFTTVFGDTFIGVPVDNGTRFLNRGIILPETESQENIEAALTGIFAANIGSHLGLYDLFSPTEQITGIGRLGLMDAGLFNLYGLAPALPSAFSRTLIGWETPVELKSPLDNAVLQRLADPSATSGTTCYKIALNSDEYFLLEYRGDYNMSVAIDSLYQDIYDRRGEPPTYLETLYKLQELYPGIMQISDSTGVLLSLDNYDWGLPGSGILIWHVDDLLIRQAGNKNAINNDPEHRAVDLEEADGSQDIGQIYSITEPGFQSELGTWLDFWFESNPAPLYKNEFSKNSAPNTLSNRNFADPHIRLTEFSDNKTETMRFNFEMENHLSGYPVVFGSRRSTGDLLMAEVDHIETPVIFTSTDDGLIVAFTKDGEGLGIYPQLHNVVWVGILLDQPVLTLADKTNNGSADLLLAAGKSGRIELIDLVTGQMDTTMDLGREIILPIITQDSYFYVGYPDGTIERYIFTGVLDSTYSNNHPISGFAVVSPQELYVVEDGLYGPFIIDLNGNGQNDIVVVEDARHLSLTVDGREQRFTLADSCMAPPSFADIDNDGYYEIILTLADRLLVMNYNGTPANGFPFIPRVSTAGNFRGTALIVNREDNDGILIIINDVYGNAYGCNSKGEDVSDFSFSTGSTITQSGVVTDIDGDGSLDYLLGNNRGFIQGWRLNIPIPDKSIWWAQPSFDFTRNKYIETVLPLPISNENELLPKNRVYNYPNPNKENHTMLRYYLREDAAVSITIFDLAGDLVDRFSGPGTGKIDNEIQWNLDNIASGIYLAHIKAKSAKTTEAHIIKIMVVH